MLPLVAVLALPLFWCRLLLLWLFGRLSHLPPLEAGICLLVALLAFDALASFVARIPLVVTRVFSSVAATSVTERSLLLHEELLALFHVFLHVHQHLLDLLIA